MEGRIPFFHPVEKAMGGSKFRPPVPSPLPPKKDRDAKVALEKTREFDISETFKKEDCKTCETSQQL